MTESPVPELVSGDIYELRTEDVESAMLLRNPFRLGMSEVQDDYRYYRHTVGEDFDDENIDAVQASEHISLIGLLLDKLEYMDLRVQKVAQLVFDFGGILPPHLDHNAVNEETRMSILVPIAHDGLFRTHHTEERVSAESKYRPSDVLFMNQSPPTLHSARSMASDIDSEAGFQERILWIFDCE